MRGMSQSDVIESIPTGHAKHRETVKMKVKWGIAAFSRANLLKAKIGSHHQQLGVDSMWVQNLDKTTSPTFRLGSLCKSVTILEDLISALETNATDAAGQMRSETSPLAGLPRRVHALHRYISGLRR